MTTKTKPRRSQTPTPDLGLSALQGPDEVRAILRELRPIRSSPEPRECRPADCC